VCVQIFMCMWAGVCGVFTRVCAVAVETLPQLRSPECIPDRMKGNFSILMAGISASIPALAGQCLYTCVYVCVCARVRERKSV